jgi:hypothetical protein
VATNTMSQTKAPLHDVKVHVKVRIAMLWVAIMFLYVYNDIFSLYVPGALQQVLAGKMGSFPPTGQGLLFMFAVSMAIPCLMVFLPLVMSAAWSRWVNIGIGLFYAVFVGWTLTMPGAWGFYIFLGVVEVALTLLIVWSAWTWPRREAGSQVPRESL